MTPYLLFYEEQDQQREEVGMKRVRGVDDVSSSDYEDDEGDDEEADDSGRREEPSAKKYRSRYYDKRDVIWIYT